MISITRGKPKPKNDRSMLRCCPLKTTNKEHKFAKPTEYSDLNHKEQVNIKPTVRQKKNVMHPAKTVLHSISYSQSPNPIALMKTGAKKRTESDKNTSIAKKEDSIRVTYHTFRGAQTTLT